MLLQIGRLGINHYLSTAGAPGWSYTVTLLGLAILWLGGGNLIYFFILKPNENKSRAKKPRWAIDSVHGIRWRHTRFGPRTATNVPMSAVGRYCWKSRKPCGLENFRNCLDSGNFHLKCPPDQDGRAK